LNEIEKEEKEKLWYYSQLQGLSKRLDELPHVETVSRLGYLPSTGQGSSREGPGQGASHRSLPPFPAVFDADGPDPAAAGV
jgi:hypothetical protein